MWSQFNKVTHAGVTGATIRLAAESAPDKPLYTAASDAAGAFRIESVQEAHYVASFDAPRGFHLPQFWDPW